MKVMDLKLNYVSKYNFPNFSMGGLWVNGSNIHCDVILLSATLTQPGHTILSAPELNIISII